MDMVVLSRGTHTFFSAAVGVKRVPPPSVALSGRRVSWQYLYFFQRGFHWLQHWRLTFSVFTVGLTLMVSTLLGRIRSPSSLPGSRSCFWLTIRWISDVIHTTQNKISTKRQQQRDEKGGRKVSIMWVSTSTEL